MSLPLHGNLGKSMGREQLHTMLLHLISRYVINASAEYGCGIREGTPGWENKHWYFRVLIRGRVVFQMDNESIRQCALQKRNALDQAWPNSVLEGQCPCRVSLRSIRKGSSRCPNPFIGFTLRSESFEWLKGVWVSWSALLRHHPVSIWRCRHRASAQRIMGASVH